MHIAASCGRLPAIQTLETQPQRLQQQKLQQLQQRSGGGVIRRFIEPADPMGRRRRRERASVYLVLIYILICTPKGLRIYTFTSFVEDLGALFA